MLAAVAISVLTVPLRGVTVRAAATVTIVRPGMASDAAPELGIEVQRREVVRPLTDGGEQAIYLIEFE